MENLSLSRHHNRSSSSLPKKASNGNGHGNGGFSYGSGKTANLATTYDDVFGGPPRFGGAPSLSPRLEDYCEIFAGFNGSSRAAVSSIPVLDLPIVDERDIFFDVRSNGFDYNEVFGGFNDLDFAPSYEELFMQRSTVADGDSSDDAWTPEEVESFSGGGTEHSNGRDSYDSIDGSTEFNVSYNKANQMCDTNMSCGVIRVADLGAIPSYTVEVDEMVCVGETTKVKKVSDSSSSKYAFEDKDREEKCYSEATMSFPSQPFVTVSEIGLKTHPTGIPPPSRPPPMLTSDFRSLASNSGTTGSEGSGGGSSPLFFDVEVDESSDAVREAMVKAEARLKNAKDLLERKRNGVRTTTKQASMNNSMIEKGKSSHTAILPDLDNNIDVAKTSMRDKHGSKFLSSQRPANCDRNDEWEAATQYVEIVRTELPKNAVENSGGKETPFPLNAAFFDQKLTWAANVDWGNQQRRAKGDREDHEAKKLPKHSGTRKVASRHKSYEDSLAVKNLEESNKEKLRDVELQFEIGNKFPSHGGVVKHRNLLRPEDTKLSIEKLVKQNKELHCEEKTKRMQTQQSDRILHQKAAEKNQDCVFDWEQNARKLREALGLADNESTLEVSMDLKRNGRNLATGSETDESDSDTKLNEALRRMEEETRSAEFHVSEETNRREAFEKAENEKRLKAALEQEEKLKLLKEAREKEENERRAAEAGKEQDRKMKEQEEYELRLKETFEKEGKNRKMREGREKVEHERKLEVAREQEKERKMKEAHEKEEKERKIKEAREKAELEQRLKETLEQEEKERRIKEVKEREENERRAKMVLEQEANERKLKEALEQKEKERRLKEAHEKEENEKKLKEAIELEEKEKRLIEAFERAETERRQREDIEHDEVGISLEEAKEREESDKKQRHPCEMENTCDTTNEAYGEQRSEESFSDNLEEDEREENHKSVNKVQEEEEEEEEGPSQRESVSEEACPWKVFEKNLKDASQKEGASELDRTGESDEDSAFITDYVQGEKLDQKSKKFESTIDASVFKGDGGVKTEVEDENIRNAGVDGDLKIPEEGKCANKSSSGFKNHEDKFTHQQERSNIYETKAGLNQNANLERPLPSRVSAQREKEAERLKRERDTEMERFRKIEEERDREREREKDRMAFDQRALADARERLEKACADARERSLPNKVSIEARLRAERAAVERATTEARERAAEKAAFEARERMERSVSDKQFQSSGLFNERMERSVSDKQFQNSASFGASRYQNSHGTDVESPQRYTSRLERHRRTADRVAKALEEKNMRDLVAQREQTERIRVAETLDAEVKRWSSGKEGNIRALLSTLQYIIGLESGWQALPLTEVITSAAVKRAYRKATLCVHPDKLQQRGATIHHKYICEKVFDLLKEAWNRFNSEER